MCHSVLPVSCQEDEHLSRPGSVLPDDASDTSVSEATNDDVDRLLYDGSGCTLAKEKGTAPPLQKNACIKRLAPCCTFCDEDIRGECDREQELDGHNELKLLYSLRKRSRLFCLLECPLEC